jgi:sugar O-acyltransferase (sialic acid O-acetyltransferase NeuD family)
VGSICGEKPNFDYDPVSDYFQKNPHFVTKPLAIVGAGGLGREIRTLIDHVNAVSAQWQLVGYYDDGLPEGALVDGYPVLGRVEDFSPEAGCHLVVAIGNPQVKMAVVEKLAAKQAVFAQLVHPSVILGNPELISLGDGVIICAGCVLTTGIHLGNHVLINLNCTIGHDSIVEEGCALMPGVNIAGEVHLAREVFVGAGANIINQLTVGSRTKIGAGAVVIKDIPANCTAVGVPARVIK